MMKRIAVLGLLTFALVTLAQGGPAPISFEGRTGPERLRLALSNTFYLELSLEAKELRICHSGIAVATYPLQSVSAGYPRILWVPRGGTGDWVDDIWTGAHLDPSKNVQRIKIVPGDSATAPTPDKPGVVPPTMDELTPVPRDFSIRCEGEKAIFVHLEGDIPGAVTQARGTTTRWEDFLAALGLHPTEAIRVRVTLSGADGSAFFRSFPDNTPELLVLP